MVITLCSLPVHIFSILLIIGLQNLELHIEHTLILEDIDSYARAYVLDETSMSTRSHFIVMSYKLSDAETWSVDSHTVEFNGDFGSIGFAFNVD